MDKIVRAIQLKLLESFSKVSATFALSGGTAMELFYLKHRFSRDLDFFSPRYDIKEIENIVSEFNKGIGGRLKLENELFTSDKAKIRFYTAMVKKSSTPIKIDFVEDVLLNRPVIERFKGIPVYSINNIYFQKIITLIGTHFITDITGKTGVSGRKEARDIVDVYYLSKDVCPLSVFMETLSSKYQRGLVYWYRGYSRQELKLGVLDLDIYDNKFDTSSMIAHIDSEIKRFISKKIRGGL